MTVPSPAAARSAADLFGDTQEWQTRIYRKRLAVNVLVRGNAAQFRADFVDWLELNWAIWLAFEEEASRAWGRGFRHFGARNIAEHIRYETKLREGPNEHGFKLNNNQVPDLARLYELVHPDRGGFFERRVQPLSVRSA